MDEKCKKIMECLSDYIDGETSETLCKMMEKHFNECDECKCVVENLKTTIKVLRSLPEEEVPESIEKSVLNNLTRILFQ